MTVAQLTAVLKEQVDVRRKSVGMAAGVITTAGRTIAACGAVRPGDLPVTGDTTIGLASLTKAFTCVLLADMVRRGEVTLDDPVARHLPDGVCVPAWKNTPIRLVHLAMHTSGLPLQPPGLPTLDSPGSANYTRDQLWASLADVELTRPIGSRWEYGNFDMALLGQALAYRAGTDYATLVADRISGPLGMSSTVVGADTAGDVHSSPAYAPDLRPVVSLAIGALAPAAGIRSSVNDLLTFAAALLDMQPSPLSGLLDTMLRHRRSVRPSLRDIDWRLALRMLLPKPKGLPPAERFFTRGETGLGWFIFGRGAEELVAHDGSAPGCSASLALDRRSRTAAVVLSNTGVNIHDVSRHLLWPDYPLSRLRTEVPIPAATLDRYVGTYQIPGGPPLTIERAGDRLAITLPVVGRLVLRAENAREFFVPELDFEIRFAEGAITELFLKPFRASPSVPLRRLS